MNWMQAWNQDGATCHQLFPGGGGMSQLMNRFLFHNLFSKYFFKYFPGTYVSRIFCDFSFISKCQWNDATCVSFSGIFQPLSRFQVQCTLYTSRIVIRSTRQPNRLFQVLVICHKCYGHFSTFVVASYSNLPLIMPGQCTRKEKKVKIYKTQGKNAIIGVCEGKLAVGSQFMSV